MTKGVIHFLEVVEVEQQHRYFTSHAAGMSQGLIQTVIQQPAIRQAGEFVVIGEIVAAL